VNRCLESSIYRTVHREQKEKDNRCGRWNKLSVIYYHHHIIFIWFDPVRLSYCKEIEKKTFFYLYVSSYCYCVKMKNHPNGMQLVCMWMRGWWKEKRTERRRRRKGGGGVVERKADDRFVLFFFSFQLRFMTMKGKRRKKEKEKERGCFFYFLVRRTGARAPTRIHTERSRKMRDTYTYWMNRSSSVLVSIR
jgi:hypothetical protein